MTLIGSNVVKCVTDQDDFLEYVCSVVFQLSLCPISQANLYHSLDNVYHSLDNVFR